MFYFINGFCDIPDETKINEEISVRNPNKEEMAFFLQIIKEDNKEWENSTFQESENKIFKLLEKLVIIDFQDTDMNVSKFDKDTFIKHWTKYNHYQYLINIISFITTRLQLWWEDTQLSYWVKFTWRIDTKWKDFISHILISEFLDLGFTEHLHKFDIEIFKEVFWLISINPENIERLKFIWETITSIFDINDHKLKLILLMWIIENFVVKWNNNIESQIKTKLVPIFNKIEHYNIIHSIWSDEKIFTDFNSMYLIRSKIAHWDFKSIDQIIKDHFWKEHSIASVTLTLEQRVARIIYMYICEPSLFNVLKKL